jgi:hypothetical protein
LHVGPPRLDFRFRYPVASLQFFFDAVESEEQLTDAVERARDDR